jgi:transforming growth factor-beta-induced protein
MVHFTCLSFVLAALTLSSSVTVAQNSSTSFGSILASTPNLSNLSSAIAAANITFSGTDPITVFAPTNAAFAKLDTAVLQKLLLPEWIAHLNNVLLMHVVAEELLSTDLTNGAEVPAENGESIVVSIADGNISVSSPNTNNSVVSSADISGDEGVLHQVDSVLLPSFVTTDLLSLAGSVSGFSIIKELLEFSGLVTFVGPNTTATVFAPTDEAFEALGDDALAYYRSDKAATTKLLTGHVLQTIVPTQLMVNGMSIGDTPAMETLTATVETDADGDTVYKVNNATIVDPNILAINGIIHSLGSVLVVPGAEYPPVNSTTPSGPTAPTPARAPTVKAPTTSDAMARGYFAGVLFAGIGWVAAVFSE